MDCAVVSLAQRVSPSVALSAELVFPYFFTQLPLTVCNKHTTARIMYWGSPLCPNDYLRVNYGYERLIAKYFTPFTLNLSENIFVLP